MTDVPRGTIVHPNGRVTVILADGQKGCGRCRQRPRAVGQQWCQVCRTEYNRERRQGKIEVLLTPEEWTVVLRWRAVRASVMDLAEYPRSQAACRGDG